MKKINNDIYLINSSLSVSNQYLIINKDCLLLIDTGLRGNTSHILSAIKTLGFKASDIKYIFITHADGDHVGSLSELKDKTNAVVCSSDIEKSAIEKGESSRALKLDNFANRIYRPLSVLVKPKPTKVDRILVPGQIISQFYGLKIIDSKGHTPGHLSFYLEKQKVLFSGDSINITGSNLDPASGMNCWDEGKSKQSFEDQLELKPKFICGGHGFWKKQ